MKLRQIEKDIFKSNFEKYKDPESYDLDYENYLNDVPFLAECAEKSNGTIIDLACGTGRVTIPLAQLGHRLIGVDLHAGMLNRASEKAVNPPLSVEWVLQDCTQLSLDITVPFIYITGNSFQHFLTNESQNQLLHSVSSHLETNGIFVFNTRFPILSELCEVDRSIRVYRDKHSRKIQEQNTETFHSVTQILHCTSVREIREGPDKRTVVKATISLRYVFPLEMERLLQQNGFTILKTYSSWDKKPLEPSSSEMIYVCIKQ